MDKVATQRKRASYAAIQIKPAAPAHFLGDFFAWDHILFKELQPRGIAPPFARYAHGVEIPAGYRVVATSGQLAVDRDGDVPEGAEAQAVLCFSNISAILAEAGMKPADTVRINAFVTDRAHMAGYMTARDAWLTGVERLPTSTLVIVAGFTRPEFLVEIEVLAAAR